MTRTTPRVVQSRARLSGGTAEQGIILIGVLLLLMLMGAATVALTVGGQTELAIARNHEAAAQAQAAAEAGLNHGIEVTRVYLNSWQANGFASMSAAMTRLGRGPDDQIGTTAYNADNGSLETLGIPREPTRTTLTGTTAAYSVRVFDDDDPARGFTMSSAEQAIAGENGTATSDGNSRLVVRAIGYAGEGTMVRLEATIGSPPSIAIKANGNCMISGDLNLVGSGGSIHCNGNLTISGNPDISENATATGTYTAGGNPDVGGYSGGSYPTETVSAIRAIDYRPNADYVMKSNGHMTLLNGTLVCDASSDNAACVNLGYAWQYQGSNGWQYEGSAVPANTDNKTWYFETDVKIASNPGNNPDALNITIISTRNIDIGGNPTVEADTPGVLFVADRDIAITGSMRQIGAEARILVHEQLKLSGVAWIFGVIEMENVGSASGLVDNHEFSSQAIITNSGSLSGGGFIISAWREIR